MAEPLPSSITLTRTEFPDSIELGRTSNASDLPEAQRRIDAAVQARQYLLQRLGGALD